MCDHFLCYSFQPGLSPDTYYLTLREAFQSGANGNKSAFQLQGQPAGFWRTVRSESGPLCFTLALQCALLFCMRYLVLSTEPEGGEQPAEKGNPGGSFQAFSIASAKIKTQSAKGIRPRSHSKLESNPGLGFLARGSLQSRNLAPSPPTEQN